MIEKVFENIGTKIKMLAKIQWVAGIILSICFLIVFLIMEIEGIFSFGLGLLISVSVFLSSYVSSLLTYGFGEAIDRAISVDEQIKE